MPVDIAESPARMAREQGSAHFTRNLGEVVTMVRVHWAYIAYRMSKKSLGTIAFLTLAVVFNNSLKAPIWRSSINELLQHEFDHDTRGPLALKTVSR